MRVTTPFIVPEIVRDELRHPKAPAVVRNWIASPPDWVEIAMPKSKFTIRRSNYLTRRVSGHHPCDRSPRGFAADGREDGIAAARGKGLEVTGTLGILVRAAQRRLLALREAVDRLKQTNFRFRQDILDPYVTQQGDNN